MGQVVSFVNYRPAARFDGNPWTTVVIEEGASLQGPWTVIDTIIFSDPDADPEVPALRSFTTDNASLTPALWYRATFVDGSAASSQPTTPVQNVDDQSFYVTREEIKSTARVTGSYADEDIDRALLAASRGVEKACGNRKFYPGATSDVVRYYTPVAPDKIVINDLVDLTSLVSSQLGSGSFTRDWTFNEDFVLEPANAVLDSKPFTSIVLNRWQATEAFPYWAPRSVQVTGRWGWPATPGQITEAVFLLTNRLLERSRTAALGVIFDADVAMRIAYSDPDIKNLMQDFIREEIG